MCATDSIIKMSVTELIEHAEEKIKSDFKEEKQCHLKDALIESAAILHLVKKEHDKCKIEDLKLFKEHIDRLHEYLPSSALATGVFPDNEGNM